MLMLQPAESRHNSEMADEGARYVELSERLQQVESQVQGHQKDADLVQALPVQVSHFSHPLSCPTAEVACVCPLNG